MQDHHNDRKQEQQEEVGPAGSVSLGSVDAEAEASADSWRRRSKTTLSRPIAGALGLGETETAAFAASSLAAFGESTVRRLLSLVLGRIGLQAVLRGVDPEQIVHMARGLEAITERIIAVTDGARRCFWCYSKSAALQSDHVVQQVRGGMAAGDFIGVLLPSCEHCNKKRPEDPIEWLRSRDRSGDPNSFAEREAVLKHLKRMPLLPRHSYAMEFAVAMVLIRNVAEDAAETLHNKMSTATGLAERTRTWLARSSSLLLAAFGDEAVAVGPVGDHLDAPAATGDIYDLHGFDRHGLDRAGDPDPILLHQKALAAAERLAKRQANRVDQTWREHMVLSALGPRRRTKEQVEARNELEALRICYWCGATPRSRRRRATSPGCPLECPAVTGCPSFGWACGQGAACDGGHAA